MSRTYNIACKDCNISLWIGQGSRGGIQHIYTTEDHLAKLQAFLFQHLGHSLVFDDSETLDNFNEVATGCGQKLAAGQHWAFCGETDMGQTMPALCTDCGGEYLLLEPHKHENGDGLKRPITGTVQWSQSENKRIDMGITESEDANINRTIPG